MDEEMTYHGKGLFEEDDRKRLAAYWENVKSGKEKIVGGALLPHEISKELAADSNVDPEIVELQWARMVEDLAKKGKFKNCMAICGSMLLIPVEVSVPLGLLISQLSEEPWKGKVMTFSENPELCLVEGESLKSKISFIREMHCDLFMDFPKVFDQILNVTVERRLRNDQMIERLFVFHDFGFDGAWMDHDWDECFDQAISDLGMEDRIHDEHNYLTPEEQLAIEEHIDMLADKRAREKWKTDYEAIQRKFKEKGLNVPEIVFWNLRDLTETPEVTKQEGVTILNGFSNKLLKVILERGGNVDPETLGSEEFKKLSINN